MTMASRDIANMHVFLDLKKKFPDLPDETLRNYISLFAEDPEKCLSLLQKESENHYHPSQPFPDFRLPENKVSSIRNDYVKHFMQNLNDGSSPIGNLEQLYIPIINKNFPASTGRSSSHAGILQLPGNYTNQNVIYKPEPLSAPIITNNERPFKDIYKQDSVSSQATSHLPSDVSNQFIFHTTKNHIIEVPKCHESTAYLSLSGEPEVSRKHAVKLSITPSFPFHQQHINVFNNSVCTTTSHSSRPDRHTTSVNFQLQPRTSNQLPLEISTIPTNIGQPCDSKDFCSHVQISVGEQGTTFTAVRLQHPNYLQTVNTNQLPINEAYMPSSQAQNSNSHLFSKRRIQLSPGAGKVQSFKNLDVVGLDQNKNMYISKGAQGGSVQSYDYILAVKNQQIAQLDLILNELEKEKSICSQLKAEVSNLEQEIVKRKAVATFSYAEELQKLREEIKKLRVEIGCLSMEVDSAGQIPLGVTDEERYEPNRTANQNLPQPGNKSSYEEEDDEKNQWRCKNCTFANHPALEKCEICELPKNFDSVESNSSYSPHTHFQLVTAPKPQPRRAVGSIQISVTHRVPTSNSVKLQLTHRLPR